MSSLLPPLFAVYYLSQSASLVAISHSSYSFGCSSFKGVTCKSSLNNGSSVSCICLYVWLVVLSLVGVRPEGGVPCWRQLLIRWMKQIPGRSATLYYCRFEQKDLISLLSIMKYIQLLGACCWIVGFVSTQLSHSYMWYCTWTAVFRIFFFPIPL